MFNYTTYLNQYVTSSSDMSDYQHGQQARLEIVKPERRFSRSALAEMATVIVTNFAAEPMDYMWLKLVNQSVSNQLVSSWLQVSQKFNPCTEEVCTEA